MGRIRVDGGQWPVVVVTFPPRVEDSDMLEYLDELRVYRKRREPYAIVVNAEGTLGLSARQRHMQAAYVAEGLGLSRRYLKALAFVARSALTRGMLTAIFWIQKPASPYRVFLNSEEAFAWAAAAVGSAGQSMAQPDVRRAC